MKDGINIPLTASLSKRATAGAMISRRVYGPWRIWGGYLLIVLTGLLFGLGFRWLYGFEIASVTRTAVFTILGCLIGLVLSTKWLSASYLATQTKEPDVKAAMSEQGISVTTTVPWADISDSFRTADMTVLMFSAAEGFMVQDSDLPPDLSPEQFQTRIAAWRARTPK